MNSRLRNALGMFTGLLDSGEHDMRAERKIVAMFGLTRTELSEVLAAYDETDRARQRSHNGSERNAYQMHVHRFTAQQIESAMQLAGGLALSEESAIADQRTQVLP